MLRQNADNTIDRGSNVVMARSLRCGKGTTLVDVTATVTGAKGIIAWPSSERYV